MVSSFQLDQSFSTSSNPFPRQQYTAYLRQRHQIHVLIKLIQPSLPHLFHDVTLVTCPSDIVNMKLIFHNIYRIGIRAFPGFSLRGSARSHRRWQMKCPSPKENTVHIEGKKRNEIGKDCSTHNTKDLGKYTKLCRLLTLLFFSTARAINSCFVVSQVAWSARDLPDTKEQSLINKAVCFY